MDPSKAAATAFLTSLLSKTLRVTTTDTRLFVGEFKCTDADRNIILSRTYEYRVPSPPTSPEHSTPTPAPIVPSSRAPESEAGAESESEIKHGAPSTGTETVRLDLTSRYLGLVVVPGEFIAKVEVEEFASQVGLGGSRYAGAAAAARVRAGLVAPGEDVDA